MSERITAHDIAERLSVSRSTVSRAFDPNSRISPDVRRRILKMAHEIGYRPTVASRLVMREYPHVIALIVRDITNPVRATIMTRLIREFEREGTLPLVFQVPNARIASTRAETIMGYLPSAVVMSGFMPQASLLTQCSQRSIPALVINRGQTVGLAANYVTSDHYAGGMAAARFLTKAGCQRIAFVSGHSGVVNADPSEARIEGFLAGLDEAGSVAVAAYEGDHSYESGVKAADKFFGAPNPPDGVFCGNDMMAMGFKDTARETYGMNAPQDYQLIGYDNIEMANWTAYRLSTVAQNMDAVLEATVQGIRQLLQDPETPVRVTLPVDLIERSTTSGNEP
ncbi:LacI family DNA-binding transcriptional regulator [Granulosicoccus sp. 3-233]|uniref:LacI family DNA-binding transcriptional regulator n=1 Tax=Granulosicoccus sp. 3-233 TaxID=3417969 RepID=UPI003D32BBBA